MENVGDDLIFLAVGSEIRALSSKGKEVYNFNISFLAEATKIVRVHGFKLWVIGDSLLNQFEMGEPSLLNKKSRKVSGGTQRTREISYYLSEDRINDAYLFRQAVEAMCVILRQNCQLQLIDKGEVVCSLKTESIPQCCGEWQFKQQIDGRQSNLIGLSSGNILIVDTTINHSNKRSISTSMEIRAPGNRVVSVLEISKGVLVCRSNQLEIWSRDEQEKFEKRWEKRSEEAAVKCVALRSSDTILCCTFSGKLLCLDVVDGQQHQKARQQKEKAKEQEDMRPRLQSLNKQVQSLEAERAKLKIALQAKLGSKLEKYKLSHSLSLNPSLQSYRLEIKCSLPVVKVVFEGCLRLKSDRPVINFADRTKNERSASCARCVVSLQGGESNPCFEYFVSESTENSQISCYLHLQGDKEFVVVLPLELRCLALHIKTDNQLPVGVSNNWSKLENRKDLNQLSVSGRFSRVEMNAWLSSILEMPRNLPEDDRVVLVHESVATKQKIITQFAQNQAAFTAQNLAVLLVIRKALAKKFKERELGIKMKLEPNQLAVETTLKALEAKMLEYQNIELQYALLPGLLEISQQELQAGGDRYRTILANQQSIREQHHLNQPFYNELKNSILELYSSYQSAKKQEVSQFQRANLAKKLVNFRPSEVLQIITG